MDFVQNYVKNGFPIETDICQSVYGAVSGAMFNREHLGIRQSGLYGTRAFYNPVPHEVVPVLFGTIYNGTEYAEVLFSKSARNKLGKLEVKLCGEDQERLLKIKSHIKHEVANILKEEKK